MLTIDSFNDYDMVLMMVFLFESEIMTKLILCVSHTDIFTRMNAIVDGGRKVVKLLISVSSKSTMCIESIDAVTRIEKESYSFGGSFAKVTFINGETFPLSG
jgi:hypothetical protein